MKNTENGASFLDIMIAIVILSLLVSVIAPYFQQTIDGSNVMQVIEQIRSASSLYRQDAMSTGSPVIMSINGCSVSATYSQNSSSYESLPAYTYNYTALNCSSNQSTLVWNPDGLVTDATGNVVSATIQVSGGGINGVLNIHGGGSVSGTQ